MDENDGSSHIVKYKYKTFRKLCSFCKIVLNDKKRKRKYIISHGAQYIVDVACSIECAREIIKNENKLCYGND